MPTTPPPHPAEGGTLTWALEPSTRAEIRVSGRLTGWRTGAARGVFLSLPPATIDRLDALTIGSRNGALVALIELALEQIERDKARLSVTQT